MFRALVPALVCALLVPAVASGQAAFPLYGKDKFLGSVNDFTTRVPRGTSTRSPENAGKWGSAAGTTRTAAMRWGAARHGLQLRQDANNFQFNFHVLLWGNQQPTWMATLPPEEQLAEIKKWFAAVADALPEHRRGCRSSTRRRGIRRTARCRRTPARTSSSSGNYVQALGGANGTDGTGYDWILNAFRLAKQYFPNTKLMLNDVAITGMTAATDEYLKIINILKRENLIDVIGLQAHAFEFIPNNPNVPTIPGHPYEPVDDMAVHKANLDRLAATGIPIQITELDLDGLRGRRRARRRDAARATTATSSRPSGSTPPSKASRCGAGGSPTTGATPRTRRSCSPTARSSPPARGSSTTSTGSRR